MSVPAPAMLHVPLLSDWSPTTSGLPTAAQFHGTGHGVAGGYGFGTGGDVATAAPLIVAVAEFPLALDVATAPASTDAGSASVAFVPGTSVHVVPFGDVAASKVSPKRTTSTYAGAPLDATVLATCVLPLGAVR